MTKHFNNFNKTIGMETFNFGRLDSTTCDASLALFGSLGTKVFIDVDYKHNNKYKVYINNSDKALTPNTIDRNPFAMQVFNCCWDNILRLAEPKLEEISQEQFNELWNKLYNK